MSEYIIVGHGLAGSALAHRLLSMGKKIRVFDAGFPHSASEVSVGLVNPLIGPKLNPPHKILECLEENNQFFQTCENRWEDSFYSSIPLHRIFISEKQKDRWFELMKDQKYAQFTGEFLTSEDCKKRGMNAPFGAGLTKRAYQLNVSAFLNASKQYLMNNDSWESNKFDLEEYNDEQKIIFCEGFRVIDNPLFNHLPFAPARGETLQIKTMVQTPMSNGSWYLPDGLGCALIGSTWDHENLLSGPTKEGKNEIIKKCNFVKIEEEQIEEEFSGVRSGTRDRNPIIGVHPQKNNYFLFNGFGSRGTSTIPYYSKKMIDFIIHKKELPEEINLQRFENGKFYNL